jgi:hypothetical protein
VDTAGSIETLVALLAFDNLAVAAGAEGGRFSLVSRETGV